MSRPAEKLAVLDLAGGAGHPAIPLAMELPHACITLTGVRPTPIARTLKSLAHKAAAGAALITQCAVSNRARQLSWCPLCYQVRRSIRQSRYTVCAGPLRCWTFTSISLYHFAQISVPR